MPDSVRDSADGTFDAAVEQYFSAIDRGDSVNVSRLAAAFPGHREELMRFVAAERELADHWLPAPERGDGAPPASQPAHIGRFRILRRIGAGAFGVVYLAYDETLKRSAALKVPLPQVIGDGEVRRRFAAEAAAAAGLDHRGIVSVYEADFAGPTPYIASAFCPGPDLGQWLERRERPVPWRDAALFMAQLADAVAFAHRSQVYHRDLKPSNVMLMPRQEGSGDSEKLEDFSPQLTDFGLAKCALLSERQTRSSMVLGTPLYMAPEQMESTRSEWPIQADVYSLGCMLYELLARRLPISGETYADVLDQLRDRRPTPLRTLVPDVPANLATVCRKCLEKDPQARYSSAEELADDLRACAEGRPIAASKPSVAARFRYWSTRPQRIYEAGLYALRVQLLLAVWLSIAVLSAVVQLLEPTAVPRVIGELLAINGLVHVPMALVGWQTMRRKQWAIHAGLGLTILNLLLPPIFISFDVPLFFADIYDKVDASGYFAGTTCVLVFLSEAGQLFLYGTALAASRHAKRLRR